MVCIPGFHSVLNSIPTEIMHWKSIVNLVAALFSVSEPIELSTAVEDVEQGVPEKEETPPPVEQGQ